MTSLYLSYYNKDTDRLELMNSYVSEALLYSHYIRSLPILMLNGLESGIYRTECMMRGLPLRITTVEPGEQVSLGTCYILHLSNEYPDFNDNSEVWVCTST